MPSRSVPVYCICPECCRTSGPKGVLFNSTGSRAAHRARTQLEQDSKQTPACVRLETPESAQESIHNAKARVFAATLLGSGSKIDVLPSKLWMSRDEFQRHRDDAYDFPNPSSVSPVDGIIESLSRLSLGNASLSSSPLPTKPSNSHPSTLAVDTIVGSSAHPLPAASNTYPSNAPTSPLDPSRSWQTLHNRPIRKQCRKDTRSLTYLYNMQQRIRSAIEILSNPSHETLCKIESEINYICSALKKITRGSADVQKEKKAVVQALMELDARVVEWRIAMPDPRKTAMVFDSSRLSSSYHRCG
jgi:hypothetical protein